MDEMGEKAWETAAWTWQSMLEAAGAVGYTAPIPVTLEDLLPEYSPGPKLKAA
jgi:hypothetical protein